MRALFQAFRKLTPKRQIASSEVFTTLLLSFLGSQENIHLHHTSQAEASTLTLLFSRTLQFQFKKRAGVSLIFLYQATRQVQMKTQSPKVWQEHSKEKH
jgi:hypothetical protein